MYLPDDATRVEDFALELVGAVKGVGWELPGDSGLWLLPTPL